MSPIIFTQRKGFTLIEVILTISLMAILATSALPIFGNFSDGAQAAVDDYVASSVQTGITLKQMENMVMTGMPTYPNQLDIAPVGAVASSNNPLFTQVLSQPVTKGWKKVDQVRYQSPKGALYAYNSQNGSFSTQNAKKLAAAQPKAAQPKVAGGAPAPANNPQINGAIAPWAVK